MTKAESSTELAGLLNKQHIIPTITSQQLQKNPGDVEHGYLVHAKTHVPLGDTEDTVATAFKWLSGVNKGALIGGVTGDYGEGKTSFLIHTWAELTRLGSLVTPPFSWKSVAEIINGTHGWVMYKLASDHPDQARAAQTVWETYREKSLEEHAQKIAASSGEPFETVLGILRQSDTRPEVGVESLLDYLEAVAPVVRKAGFHGILVSLDEAELAGRGGRASTADVASILFEMANGLISRSGDYGVFVSIPENFMAQLRAAFGSLPPRLEQRKCFVTLASLYDGHFARTLWHRYSVVLDFQAKAKDVIPDITLDALGQITSSARRDLSYGPRTVITAFRRAVELFTESNAAYSPMQLIRDIQSQDVTVRDAYRTEVNRILRSQVSEELGEEEVLVLASFPEGIHVDVLRELDIDHEMVNRVARPGHPQLWRRNNRVGILALQKSTGLDQQSFLEEQIVDVATRFAPRPQVLASALNAFQSHVTPIVFPKQRGQAITGWNYKEATKLTDDLRLVRLQGAFEQTKRYPERLVDLVVGPHNTDPKKLLLRYAPGEEPDILILLRLWWQPDVPMPDETLVLDTGDAANHIPATITADLDFSGVLVENEHLANATGDPEQLTPLFTLYLASEIERLSLSKGDEAVWTTVRDSSVRRVATALLGDDVLRESAESCIDEALPGDPLDLLPAITRWILERRHPSYETLIVQPGWAAKVRTYLNLIKNSDIPASAKRGLEPWKASKTEAERAFNAGLMNITGGWGDGLESLIGIEKGPTVTFRLHPLEQEIQDLIIAQPEGHRVEIDGSLCWWMPLELVASHVVASGYREEELKYLVDIGTSRGSFDITKIRGKRALFCRPFDPEQKRNMLREHGKSLKDRDAALSSLPGSVSSPFLARLDEAIEGVEDDAAYERLRTSIDREIGKQKLALEQAQATLHADCHSTIESFKGVRETAQQALSRELPTDLSSSVNWGTTLLQYGLRPLRHEAKELDGECGEHEKLLRELHEGLRTSKSMPFYQIVEALAAAHSSLESAKQNSGLLRTRSEGLRLRVKDFAQWHQMLRSKAEPLHGNLLDLQEEESNREAANQFLDEFRDLSSDIEHHLATHQQAGLGSHAHFREKFEELGTRVENYFKEQKKRFNDLKASLNAVLEQAAITERTSETYNPLDVAGCYERLYSQAADCILAAVQSEMATLNDQKLELLYASDVLGSIARAEADKLLGDIKRQEESLKHFNVEIVRRLVRTDEPESSGSTATTLGNAIQASAKLQHGVRQMLSIGPDQDDETLPSSASRLLNLLQEEQDLKALVLSLMQDGEASGDALETALDGIGQLFRARKISIRLRAEPVRR